MNKKPKNNYSKEAIKLRETALAFSAHAFKESQDDIDIQGKKLNRKLLEAAINYAKITQDNK